MTERSSRAALAASLLATLAATLAIWAVFYPGLLSTDSLYHYRQAVGARFSAIWHPPLLPMLASVVFALGGDLGVLMLLQALAMLFGVRSLLAQTALHVLPAGTSRRHAPLLALAGLAVLLLPFSPLAYYAMTLWKDSWEAILMLWLGALAFRLRRLEPASDAAARMLLALLVVVATMAAMVRLNGTALLPAAAALIYLAGRGRGRRPALAAALLPLLVAPAANAWLNHRLNRHDPFAGTISEHPYSQIMLLELAGLCALSEQTCAGLPHFRSFVLHDRLAERYRPGDIGALFWEQPPILGDAVFRSPYPPLRAEYLRAVRANPLAIARLKLLSFYHLLGLERTALFFQSTIEPNDLELELDRRLASLRGRLVGFTTRAGEGGPLRWLSGVHLVWLAINLVGIAAAASSGALRRLPGSAVLVALLAVTLSYYLSYLPGTPVREFRLLYPATLVVQCLFLGWLGAFLVAAAERRRRPTSPPVA